MENRMKTPVKMAGTLAIALFACGCTHKDNNQSVIRDTARESYSDTTATATTTDTAANTGTTNGATYNKKSHLASGTTAAPVVRPGNIANSGSADMTGESTANDGDTAAQPVQVRHGVMARADGTRNLRDGTVGNGTGTDTHSTMSRGLTDNDTVNDPLKSYPYARRTEFRSAMSSQLATLNAKIDTLKSKVNSQTSVDQPNYRDMLSTLESKETRAKVKLSEARTVPKSQWEGYKIEFRDTVADLERSYDQLNTAMK